MNMDLANPFLAQHTTMSASWTNTDTGGSAGFGSGFHAVSTSFTAFTITTDGGTLTGGKIRVYGYAN